MLYTVLELTSVVASHRFPSLPKEPTPVSTSSTYVYPPNLVKDRLAAEILITKPTTLFPTPYLYVSNRNDPCPEGDSIAIFCINNPDALHLVGEVRTGLNHVRGIAFGGEEDRWLIAGGVNGGGVKVFERIDGGRNFRLAAQIKDIKAPTGFIWI
jgi:6-phosphogluconolactonase (cycloisomerase 2 family)